MTNRTKIETIQHAGQLVQDGYHCSEAMVISLGEYYFKKVPDEWIKIANPFAGGIASTQQEVCGALSGGVMVIGLLYGRTSQDQNDETCLRLTKEYREAFIQKFVHAHCHDLQEEKYGSTPGHTPCSALVSDAAALLIELLEADQASKA